MNTATLERTKSIWNIRIGTFLRTNQSALILLLLVGVLAVLTEGTFLSARNITNLTRQVALNGILAVGMTYVILIRGIDLSVGSVVALAGVICGVCQVNLGLAQWSAGGWGALLSGIAAIGVGALCGTFNGWMITRHRIAPFIITLGMMVIARGLALIFANGAAIAPLSETFNLLGQGYFRKLVSSLLIGLGCSALILPLVGQRGGQTGTDRDREASSGDSAQGRDREFAPGAHARANDFARTQWGSIFVIFALAGVALWAFQGYRGLPVPVAIFAVFAISGGFLLQRTRLGRFVMAIGGIPDAAWLAGVPIRKITFGIYVMIGALAGLSGAILSARLNGALPTAGELFELDAIAAVVIGGTSLMGGVGSIRGSVLGAFFIGILNNGMSLMDVTEFYQKVIKGVIIILAVWIDMRNAGARR